MKKTQIKKVVEWIQLDKYCLKCGDWLIDKNVVMSQGVYVLWHGKRIIGSFKSALLAKQGKVDYENSI